jgi:heme-degrading monooxygenase HmoA
MIELQIYLEPTAGNEEKLEDLFRTRFVPAISKRPGFVRVALLKSRDAVREYQLCLSFESEELRLEWVACDDHQAVWPLLHGLCQRASWSGFDVIPQD